MSHEKILVTGASGQLGSLVIDGLIAAGRQSDTVALVRREEAKSALEAKGIEVRLGDYQDRPALEAAMTGIDKLLLISSSEIGQRFVQHQTVIDAAVAAGVSFIAYTSLLRADQSTLALADEHKATETALAASGIDHAILRNGWYTENLTMSLPTELAMGQRFGAAGNGKFAPASRADYAAAAVAVLTTPGQAGKVYELAGSEAVTLAEYAALVSKVSGGQVSYTDIPEAEYAKALAGAGLPGPLADILADSDARASDGWLFSDSSDLSDLIGRPSTPIAEIIALAMQAQAA